MELLEMRWPQVAALPRTTPIVFPVAALEQHGHHMPVFTDSLLLGEIMRRVKEALQDRVLFAPLQWLGNSHHHLDFPGTMSASPRVYLDLIIDMVENFLMHGFTRLVVINGHGGNIVPLQQALFEVRQKYRRRGDLLLLSATYWTLGSDPAAVNTDLTQSQMGHACEWETSMMLQIRPDLVGDLGAVQEVPFGKAFSPAHRAWTTKDRSAPGHIGYPGAATAAKGEFLFETLSADVIALLGRVLVWDGKEWDA
jgi:creatinine amidohydrolase